MSRMKHYVASLALMSSMSAIYGNTLNGMNDTFDEEVKERKPNKSESLTDKDKAKRKGLKEFKYINKLNPNSFHPPIYALNQKSADKKAKKKGYI